MDKKLFFSLLLVVAFALAIFLYPSSGNIPIYVRAQGPPGGIPGQGGPSGWTDDGTIVRLTAITDFVGVGTQNPQAKLTVSGGDVFISDAGKGVILKKDVDGPGCHKITVNSAGAIVSAAVNCNTGEPIAGPVTENFDSYTAGTNLAGGNGGTGWTSAWAKFAGSDYIVQNTGCQSGSCVKATGSGGPEDAHDFRLFQSANSGFGTIYAKVSGESSQYVTFCKSTAGPQCGPFGTDERFYFEFSASFQNVTLKTTGFSNQVLGSLENGSWGRVDFQFGGNGGVCVSTQVRARLNNGPWSSCIEMANFGPLAGTLLLYNAAPGRELWVDELSINP